jgi:hypothetical protein
MQPSIVQVIAQCPFNVMIIAVNDKANTARKAHMAIMCGIMCFRPLPIQSNNYRHRHRREALKILLV